MERIVDDKDERMWGMFCHLSGLAGFIVPFGNIIGPLIIHSLKKDEYPFVADQGKESINFQISFTIYILISFVSVIFIVGILFLLIIPLIALILTVIASVRANEGEYYRYPLTIKFIN
jgi:hypothetical protein